MCLTYLTSVSLEQEPVDDDDMNPLQWLSK